MIMVSQIFGMTSSPFFFYVFLFLLSSVVTGLSFMSISSLVLELWQLSFIRDWPEIRKSEIPPPEFCPISGDRGKLGIKNFTRMSLIKCYWMLENASITAFTISELSREYQHPRTQISVKRAGIQWLSSNKHILQIFWLNTDCLL